MRRQMRESQKGATAVASVWLSRFWYLVSWIPAGLRFLLSKGGVDLEQRRDPVRDARLGHLHLDHVVAAREIEHHVHQDLLDYRAEAARAGAALQRFLRDRGQGRLLERDFHVLEAEQLGVLLG